MPGPVVAIQGSEIYILVQRDTPVHRDVGSLGRFSNQLRLDLEHFLVGAAERIKEFQMIVLSRPRSGSRSEIGRSRLPD